MLAMLIYCSLQIGCGYAMICWCEYRIFKFLQQADNEVYKQTRRMHAEVHRALMALVGVGFYKLSLASEGVGGFGRENRWPLPSWSHCSFQLKADMSLPGREDPSI